MGDHNIRPHQVIIIHPIIRCRIHPRGVCMDVVHPIHHPPTTIPIIIDGEEEAVIADNILPLLQEVIVSIYPWLLGDPMPRRRGVVLYHPLLTPHRANVAW